MSLRLTVLGLDPHRYDPVIALIRPTTELIEYYRSAGIETLPWSGVGTLEHTTAHWCNPVSPLCWGHMARLGSGWKKWVQRAEELIKHVSPDLIHLNSVVLVPFAEAAHRSGKRLVWHVREHPTHGVLGVRTKLIGRLLRRWPDEAIFLSEADQTAWVGAGTGVVVPNFVDTSAFSEVQRGPSRTRLGIAPDAKVILYLGGISVIKGGFVLLEALNMLRHRVPGLCCLMPGSLYLPTDRWQSRLARAVLPGGTLGQRFEGRVQALGLESVCRRVEYQTDIANFYAAADVLAFPATQAHFARPIIEAGVAGIPAVASDLEGAGELLVGGKTGVLVRPSDPAALADALESILLDPALGGRFGKAAQRYASREFDSKNGVSKIEAVYERLLDPCD